MEWDDYLDTITYKLNDREYTNIAQLKVVNDLPLEQKPMEEKKINQMSLVNCDLNEVEIVLGDKFELKIEDGKYYAVRKEHKYPTTYAGCCKMIKRSPYIDPKINMVSPEEALLFSKLIKLKRCRDAYWKIAGEQMGLDKPWEPNNIIEIYNIYRIKNTIRLGGARWVGNCNILEFPTEDMRDAFYENFKDLIEQCKELL